MPSNMNGIIEFTAGIIYCLNAFKSSTLHACGMHMPTASGFVNCVGGER